MRDHPSFKTALCCGLSSGVLLYTVSSLCSILTNFTVYVTFCITFYLTVLTKFKFYITTVFDPSCAHALASAHPPFLPFIINHSVLPSSRAAHLVAEIRTNTCKHFRETPKSNKNEHGRRIEAEMFRF